MLKWKKIALGAFAVLVLAAGAGWSSLDKETRGLLAALPTNRVIASNANWEGERATARRVRRARPSTARCRRRWTTRRPACAAAAPRARRSGPRGRRLPAQELRDAHDHPLRFGR